MTAAADLVRHTVARQLKRRDRDLTPELRLLEDLGADGLDLLEIVMELEVDLEIVLPDADYGRLATVGELIALVERLLDDKRRAAA